jgi:hypothetical protein
MGLGGGYRGGEWWTECELGVRIAERPEPLELETGYLLQQLPGQQDSSQQDDALDVSVVWANAVAVRTRASDNDAKMRFMEISLTVKR